MRFTGRADKARGLLRTHAWLVLVATLMAMGGALFAMQAKPLMYTATAEVVVSPPETTKGNPPQPDMGTERAIAQSGVVVQSGAADLGVLPDTVRHDLSVSVVLESFVLRISYSSSNPVEAVRGASALATAYVEYRNDQHGGHVATLVTSPTLPTTGSRGSLPIYLALGLIAGLSVGIAAAWLWDLLTDRVRSGAELQGLSGLPILSRLRRWDSRRSPLPSTGPAREAFAFVAARLTAMTGHGSGKTIVVTSPRHGAGTTSAVCGVATALAAQGKKVVVLAVSTGDLRADQVLGVTIPEELDRLAAIGGTSELALHPTSVRNLTVVPIGGTAGVHVELEDVHLLLERLERQSFVVVDAPPVLANADSLLLADAADLVVLVGDLRSGRREDVREAMALLDDVGPRLAGWVTNVPRRRPRRRSASPRPLESAPGKPVVPTKDERGILQVIRSEPEPAQEDPGLAMKATKKARPRPGKPLLGVPRTVTPPHDDDLPDRERGAAARPR